MISLPSHNHVLYHLTQFTYPITPRSTPITIQGKQSYILNHSNVHIYKYSFFEAFKSCNKLRIYKFNVQSSTTLSLINKNDVLKVLDHVYKKKFPRLSEKNKWRVSYVSSFSFSENKKDFFFLQSCNQSPISCLYLKSQCRFMNKFYCSKDIPKGIHVRYFKTDRSIQTEFYRNPTLSARIKKWIGLNIQTNNKIEKLMTDINAASFKENKDNDKFKNYQNNNSIKVDELQRIKAAFIEGYLVGNDQKPHGRAFKALRFAQQMLSTLMYVILLVAAMGLYKSTTGGSMFKIQLGNRIQVDPEEIHVTFNDVKGVEEAKSELMNVVEFLRNPDKFSALGGKLPKGVLLVGPPGTGKTLLARAVAGEAGVPFFHAAGPEFDEVLVGQGARRVRDLFKAAKERAPCIIFIDEIDSVGAKRTNSALHPYANQTINQLLSEMDGFHQNEGVIVLGATNRRQDLDKALLRPGRFDSEITVDVPDFFGRKEILDLFLGRILTRDINIEILAKYTIGFTGADIENMINQAALRAAIEGAEFVSMHHLERARDKVIMGPEFKKKMLDEEENRLTAYHEGGHALVAYFTKDSNLIHKVTIIPRGQSLGHTSFIQNKETHHKTKAQMLATMDTMMGGRAAEELIFGLDKVTTGASNDFLGATMIAEAMVESYGMSEKVGFRVHKDLNKDGRNSYSTSTKELIDKEVKRLLQESYDRAKTILKNHSKELKLLAEALLKYETLDAEDVKTLMSGKKLRYETKTDIKRTIIDVPNNAY